MSTILELALFAHPIPLTLLDDLNSLHKTLLVSQSSPPNKNCAKVAFFAQI
jgi:hypothetical protein